MYYGANRLAYLHKKKIFANRGSTQSQMKVKRHKFVRQKYNREFLLDCVLFSEPKRKVVLGEPFCYDFHGLFIQISGEAKLIIDTDLLDIKTGSIIFLRANQVRTWVSVTSDFSGYLLIFENEFMESFFNDALFIHRFQFFQTSQPPMLDVDFQFLQEQIDHCEKIRQELNTLQDDSHHYIRSLIYNTLIQINRTYIERYQLSTHLYQDDISLTFRKHLETHIRKRQSVEAYAELLKVSKSQLNLAIKRTSGKSASKVIRERLLTEIKRDLLYSDKNIFEIADSLGFSDSSNFTRFFKTHLGQTPLQFREDQLK